MCRVLVWFIWFTWFFSLIENRRNRANRTDMGGRAVGSDGSGRDRGQ